MLKVASPGGVVKNHSCFIDVLGSCSCNMSGVELPLPAPHIPHNGRLTFCNRYVPWESKLPPLSGGPFLRKIEYGGPFPALTAWLEREIIEQASSQIAGLHLRFYTHGFPLLVAALTMSFPLRMLAVRGCGPG